VTSYAVSLQEAGAELKVHNVLAPIEGSVEFYEAAFRSSTLSPDFGTGLLSIDLVLPPHLSQWRIALPAAGNTTDDGEVFLLHCDDENRGCRAVQKGALGHLGSLLKVDEPKDGKWRIVIWTRDRSTAIPPAIVVREAMLTKIEPAGTQFGVKLASGELKGLPRMPGAKYAGFRVAPCCENDAGKKGLRIALVPLDAGIP